MTNLADNRLVRAFADLRSAGKKALLPFITAGYPDVDTTIALLKEMESRGVRICELGIPFSDPIADGPVIQASYTDALEAGATSAKIFAAVKKYRRGTAGTDGLAVIAMVSYSIVFRHGVETYFAEARAAGFDGLIIPDLPLEEAGAVEKLASAAGLCNVTLVAPTTLPKRRIEIARHSRGFIYYISVAGITGERSALPKATIDGVAELRRHTDTPVCVGFGIAKPEMVKTVCRVADGAIVGSAIVHRIADGVAKREPREKLVARVGRFVSELLKPIR